MKRTTQVLASIGLAGTLLINAGQAFASPDDVVYQPIVDAGTNMVMAQVPLPKDWQMQPQNSAPGEPAITGPGGIRITQLQTQMFVFNPDPYMQQVYRASGQAMRPPPGIEALFEQDIAPMARQSGSKLIKRYALPALTEKSRQYDARLYKSYPTQSHFATLVSEWSDDAGTQSLLIIRYAEQAAMNMVTWHYSGSVLDAPASAFQQAKKAWLEAQLNTRYNPRQIEAYNRNQMQQAQSSMAAHQNRMRANQRAFQNTQRAITDANNATNDALMGIWESNNAASDRMQQRSINAITEQEQVYDPDTGNSYQVESGADQYWINNAGEYIPTNDLFYNPNSDPGVNAQQWYEVDIVQ